MNNLLVNKCYQFRAHPMTTERISESIGREKQYILMENEYLTSYDMISRRFDFLLQIQYYPGLY